MEFADHIGPCHREHLVASFKIGAAEIIGTEIAKLDAGAHAAIENDDSFTGGFEEVAHVCFS